MAEEKKDFVVRDRRIFSEDSQEAKKPAEESKASPAGEGKAPPAGEQAKREAGQTEAAQEQRRSAPQFPEINFSTFVVSLNASALVHLGAIEDPAAGKQAKICRWPNRRSTSSVCSKRKPAAISRTMKNS